MSSSSDVGQDSGKRKEPPATEHDLPRKKQKAGEANGPSDRNSSPTSVSRYCGECKSFISSERSHKALCGRKTVICTYPSSTSGGQAVTVELHRKEGFFAHARTCYGSESSPSETSPLAVLVGSTSSTLSAGPSSSHLRAPSPSAGQPSATSVGTASISMMVPASSLQRKASLDLEFASTSSPSTSHSCDAGTGNSCVSRPMQTIPPTSQDAHLDPSKDAPLNFATRTSEESIPLDPVDCTPVALGLTPVASERAMVNSSNKLPPDVSLSERGNAFSRSDPNPTSVGVAHTDVEACTSPDSAHCSTRHVFAAELCLPNKHEVLVRPDERTIIDEAFLLCTPYVVNTEYMALICTTCKCAVSVEDAIKHADRYHPQCKVSRTLVTQLRERYSEIVDKKIHPGEVVNAVFGLAIPMEEYVICGRCRHGYANVGSWGNHVCEKACVELNGRPLHFISLVQTFYRGPRRCYFPIRMPHSAAGATDDDWTLFQSQIHDIDVAEDEVVEPEDYRELNQFLSKEGWISLIAGCSKSELYALTAFPEDKDYLRPLAHEVFALMSKIQSIIADAGFHVRRLLGRRPCCTVR
ncbi:hypothetical protein BKA93DRAFT_754678 [Sparassis latifolia]